MLDVARKAADELGAGEQENEFLALVQKAKQLGTKPDAEKASKDKEEEDS